MKRNELNIPEGYDKDLIFGHIGLNNIIAEQENESNYTVMTKSSPNLTSAPYYRFMRFFFLNGKTEVSIDYSSMTNGPIEEKIFELLNNKFGK